MSVPRSCALTPLLRRCFTIAALRASDVWSPAIATVRIVAAGEKIAAGEADRAILLCGTGIGVAIAANKVPGARAAMCLNETLARYARQHNGANVLALGATLVNTEQALSIVDTFLDTPMREARYIRRLAKIRDLERRPRE